MARAAIIPALAPTFKKKSEKRFPDAGFSLLYQTLPTIASSLNKTDAH